MATEQRAGGPSATEGVARFELAPPRRFMLPAILLLLSEQPGYGYGLVPRLVEFRFGHVDRPAVYRALAQLERDGLVQVSAHGHQPGQARRVYSVTPLGERVLRVWMGVIREEHAHLGEVIRRYQATATIDSVLSEVEGGWVPELDLAWSPVSTTSMWRRRLMPPDNDSDDSIVPSSPTWPGDRWVRIGRTTRADCAASSDRRRMRTSLGPTSPRGVPQWADSCSIPRDRRC